MRLQTKILLAIGAFGATATVVAGMAFWIARESAFLLERSRLANEVSQSLLRLATDLAWMAHNDSVALSGRDPGNGRNDAAIRQRIEARLTTLKRAIASEIAFVRGRDEVEHEKDELATVSEIERGISDLRLARRDVEAMLAAGKADLAWPLIDHMRSDILERRVQPLIESVIAGEAAETLAADSEAQRLAVYWQIASLLVLAGILLFAPVAVSLVMRHFRARISALASATTALARGDQGVRVPTGGSDELAILADGFNRMADTLGEQQQQLRMHRDSLEITVAQRTEQLRDAIAALERTDSSRKRFFADISHELRTPLTVIRGEAEVTLRGDAKPVHEYQSTLRNVVAHVEQLGRLVDDLLQIARADAGVSIAKREAVAVGNVVAEACRDAQTIGRPRGIRVRWTTDGKEAVVLGDRVRLRQLFVILLDNAVRYSFTGGEIAVDVLAATGGLVVRVADHGVGIPPDEIESVFDRFYRGSNAIEQSADGSGLGLPVARAITEAHHGQIALESTLGAGTTVTVRLPVTLDQRSVA